MKLSDLGYLGGGVLIGFGAAWLALEDHFGEKYAEMANTNKRAYEMALGLQPLAPVQDPHQMELPLENPGLTVVKEMSAISANIVSGGLTESEVTEASEENLVSEPMKNPYHRALEVVETSTDDFVDGKPNDYGVSYIEDEEFMEEDGRAKFRVDLIMDEFNPVFLVDGDPMEDWEERLGESILVDFYKHCPPGSEPILYVRNHRTDEDYEVVRVET